MNFFEFNYNDIFSNPNSIFNRVEEKKFLKFSDYSQYSDCTNIDANPNNKEVMYRQYEYGDDIWLILYEGHDEYNKSIRLKIYKRPKNPNNKETWILKQDLQLSDILSLNGLDITSMDYCHFHPNSGILFVVFRSELLLYAVRIDTNTVNVNDILSFSLDSIFCPHTATTVSTIATSDTISLLLINETVSLKTPYCPKVADLQSVLALHLLIGINSLFSFWLTQLSEIRENITNSLHNGIPVLHYLYFLHIHQTVLIRVIKHHCHDTGITSSSNYFIEHLTNVANDYLKEAVNILLSWHSILNDDERVSAVIQEMLIMLYNNGRSFRELVLNSRLTLSAYQRLSLKKSLKKTIHEEKLLYYYDREHFRLMDQNSIISECVKLRKVAALQNYGMEHFGRLITEEEIIRQSELIILSTIHDCNFTDLQNIVSSLGYEPYKTLKSVCNNTEIKRVRDYLYYEMDLGRNSIEYQRAKTLVDQMEMAYTVCMTEITSASFRAMIYGNQIEQHSQDSQNHVQKFIDRLDKSKCRYLRQVLVKPRYDKSQGSSYQLININLDFSLGLLKNIKDNSNTSYILDGVELCLIDAEYRKILMEVEKYQKIPREHLIKWVYKWRKNVTLFVRYVTESCDADLIKEVVNIDINAGDIISKKIIDCLTEIISDSDRGIYTEIDRHIAKEVLLYILMKYPESLITRLEHLYCANLPKAKDIFIKITQFKSIHLLCQNPSCLLKKLLIRNSPLLKIVNDVYIGQIISNSLSSEFPIVLYYLLSDSRSLSTSNHSDCSDNTRKAVLFNSAIVNECSVEMFTCFNNCNSAKIAVDESHLTYLDELAYTLFLSGISYNELLESSHPVIVSTRNTLEDGNYWDFLKKRLMRPPGSDSKTDNIDQYYEANMYDFICRSGTSMPLDHIFSNQSRNPFVKEKNRNIDCPTQILLKKTEGSLPEKPKESLDYIYYLSFGRPYQAFCRVEKEFCVPGKPGCVPLDIMKDVVKTIYQMAVSNIEDQYLIGGCFVLLRLIGSRTELLRCYLTLIQWIIEWHVQFNDEGDLSGSVHTHLSEADIRKDYASKTMALFTFCLSANFSERKESRDLIIRQLEEIFIWRLKDGYYKEIKDVFSAWALVLYFCQLHGAPFSTVILQQYAKMDNWLLFLCVAEIFGYSKDQVKEALNQFEDVSIRHHISYIISKVEDSNPKMSSTQIKDDLLRYPKATNDYVKKPDKALSITSISSSNAVEKDSAINVTPIKDFLSFSYKAHKNHLLSSMKNSAKISLFELIFDCQIENNYKKDNPEEELNTVAIRLSTRKLLAYSLALGHPFISVIAYSAYLPKEEILDSSNTSEFSVFLNCLACFIVSSSPKNIQENIWIKWGGYAKLDWSEDEIIDLIVFAIENKFTKTVFDAFSVFKVDKLSFISSFYAMVTYAIENFNQVLRERFLTEFVKECTALCLSDTGLISVKDRRRVRILKDPKLIFASRLLDTSFTTALQEAEKTFGSRYLTEWLSSLCNTVSGLFQSYTKSLFPFYETNITLLLSALTLHFDSIDLDCCLDPQTHFQNHNIPVNTKSKEFMLFIENLIDDIMKTLESCYDYKRVRLAKESLALIEQVNSLHSVQHPFNHDKWKQNESSMRNMLSQRIDSNLVNSESLVDLISFALVGHVDKIEAVSLCKDNENTSTVNKEYDNSVFNDVCLCGSPNSWRRLVIHEEWQDKILNFRNFTSEDDLEKVSHVSALLNEKKWIEACLYMVEHQFSVKDAIIILMAMKVACGKMDPNKLPAFIRNYWNSQQTPSSAKDLINGLPVRRMSVILHGSVSKNNVMLLSDSEKDVNKSHRQSRLVDYCQQFLTKIPEVLIHGQELVEYIYTIYCVANKMAESYISVATGEEFDVLTKILVGTCRDKIDTADMYLGVVDLNPDKLCNFIAEVIIKVLKIEIQTHIGSTSILSSTSYQASNSFSPNKLKLNNTKTPHFSISPKHNESRRSSISSLQTTVSRLSGPPIVTTNTSVLSLHDNTLKVAERCQFRSEWTTVSALKTKNESRLMKVFSLQDILILCPNSRKLGKILFGYYQKFSLEVFGCNEDAEFLVHLLIQCHNCFTKGGDTIGISNCLKAAKDLSKLLNSNQYFVLMAQLLCRIGRFGEMPYIFANLIENHQFELLLRKDMDKEGVIVPYIFDYLNRYHKDDYEKIEIVCFKYNCYYELAETKLKMANSSIVKFKSFLGDNKMKDTIKILCSSIISSFLEACKNYLKANCYKKMEESFRKAQFYKLQQKWLEDPDKTFTVGPLIKIGKPSSTKVILPETGLPYGVRIVDLNKEQALIFLKKIANFYTAFIVNDQLKLSSDLWFELLVHHTFVNGDENYLSNYILYFGPILSSSLIQQCLYRVEKTPFKFASNKQAILNLKTMLEHCDDVFFVKKISETYKLKY